MDAVEVFTLAFVKTDAGVILSGSADWASEHTFDCENCGTIGTDGVRQAERDEVSLYVCRGHGVIARERLPF